MCLFPTHSSVQKLLNAIHTGLQVSLPTVVLQAMSVLNSLIRSVNHSHVGSQLSLIEVTGRLFSLKCLICEAWINYGFMILVILSSSSKHLPPGLPLSSFFPLLALLLHLIEPLTNEGTIATSDQKKQLKEVLETFNKTCR